MGKTNKSRQRNRKFTGLLFDVTRRRLTPVAFALMFVALGYGTVLISLAATATPPISGSGIILQPVEVAYCQITLSANCNAQSTNFPFPYQVKVYADTVKAVPAGKLVYSSNLAGPDVARIPLAPGTYDIHFNAGNLPTRFPSPVTVSSANFTMQQLYFSNESSDPRGLFTDYDGCQYSLAPGSLTQPVHCTQP